MNYPSCVAGKTSKREWGSLMIFSSNVPRAPVKYTRNWNTSAFRQILTDDFCVSFSDSQRYERDGETAFLACVCLWVKGVVDSFWLRDLWRSTSMSHMNHPQLGSLILPFASSAKTSIVECGVVVRWCSSHTLWKSKRSFTSTSVTFYNFPAIHKSRSGCSQWLLPWFVLN